MTKSQKAGFFYAIMVSEKRKNLFNQRRIKMSVLKIDKNNFDEIISGERPVLLDFYAEWCGPCRMVSPVIEEIAREHPEYAVGKINVDDEPELAGKYGVFSIPTLIAMKEGKVLRRVSGARPKEKILELFN